VPSVPMNSTQVNSAEVENNLFFNNFSFLRWHLKESKNAMNMLGKCSEAVMSTYRMTYKKRLDSTINDIDGDVRSVEMKHC